MCIIDYRYQNRSIPTHTAAIMNNLDKCNHLNSDNLYAVCMILYSDYQLYTANT